MVRVNYRFMLDTNTVSQLLRRDEAVCRRLGGFSPGEICISVITKGELLFGIERRPEATKLRRLVQEFLRTTDSLPVDDAVMEHYASFRVALETRGRTLASMDLLIAAHAGSLGLTLVSRDGAFQNIPGLVVEDWTRVEP